MNKSKLFLSATLCLSLSACFDADIAIEGEIKAYQPYGNEVLCDIAYRESANENDIGCFGFTRLPITSMDILNFDNVNYLNLDGATFSLEATRTSECRGEGGPSLNYNADAEGTLTLQPTGSEIVETYNIVSAYCIPEGGAAEEQIDSGLIKTFIAQNTTWLAQKEGVDTGGYIISAYTFKDEAELIELGYTSSLANARSNTSGIIVLESANNSIQGVIAGETMDAVVGPQEIIELLISGVTDLPVSNKETEKLLKRIQKIASEIEDGNFDDAINLATSFINQINRLERQGEISSADADDLRDLANQLIDLIS